MNKFDKLIFSLVTFVYVLCFSAIAQTNVSGGIYANTTWTLINSPYIVVDTVVVFPNVTLTIEPGVVVKFENNKMLEIRQSSLIALGTITDSITFTSNSSSPTMGSWDKIYLHLSLPSQFNYCNFRYADNGIRNIDLTTTTIKNSKFENNNTGLYSNSYGNICFVDSCIFSYNTNAIYYNNYLTVDHSYFLNNSIGIRVTNNCTITNNVIESNSTFGIFMSHSVDLNNCLIRYNGTGIECGTSNESPSVITNNIIEYNNIGIELNWYGDSIFCNKICNNSSYDALYNASLYNANIANNYWCTTDSATVASHIYDGYDNLSLALLSFSPIDTLQCYLTTSVNEIENPPLTFTLFPNPVFNYLNLYFHENTSKAELKIYNLLGVFEYSSILIQQKSNIDLSNLACGIHILEITDGKNISRRKFIKQEKIR